MTEGVFISFEGPEGAGKTTQIERLRKHLKRAKRKVLMTREPGGTPNAEQLRSLLLDKELNWSPVAEALLMNAARDSHVREVILPALRQGKVVLCDRFALSTRAYQGGGGKVDDIFLERIEREVCPKMPDLTLVFDLQFAEGLKRASVRGSADRFEAKSADYHRDVARRFLDLARQSSHPIIDATGTPDEVEARILDAVRAVMPDLGEEKD